MQNQSKELTFLGFSIKARKILYGANTIEGDRHTKYALLMCKSAGANTRKDMAALSRKWNIPCYVTTEALLEELVFRNNCKTAALTDKALAQAFLSNLTGQFELFEGGEDK